METMTRAQAARAGLNKYDTGLPCRNGHRAERYVQSGVCQECLRESQRRAQAAYKAAEDPLKGDRKRFAQNVGVREERVPQEQLDALMVIAESLLACRFPALVGNVVMRVDPRPRKALGGTVAADFLVDEADRVALHSVCDDALRRFGLTAVQQFVPTP